MTLTDVIAKRTVYGKRAIVTDNSSSDAVRITQTGSGNALVVEDSTNPDATPFVVDSEGRVLSGITSSYPTIYGNIPSVQLVSQFQVSPLAIGRYGANAFGADIDFTKTRGTVASNHTIVQNGDQLGNLVWAGSNGTSYIPASAISSLVDGIPSATSMPGRIDFSTTPVGSVTPQVRIRIDNAGNVGVGTNSPVNKLQVAGSFGRGAPVTKTADFTLSDTENWVIVNKGSSCTVTLPSASSWIGREFTIKVITAHTVVSASNNVVPANSATAGTAILSAIAGAWATLVSDGTNWIIMANS